LARLAWKWLQIGTDMLLTITSTGNELLRSVNINDLEWLSTPEIRGFSEFFSIFGLQYAQVMVENQNYYKVAQPLLYITNCGFIYDVKI